jgi:hypothetical protein
MKCEVNPTPISVVTERMKLLPRRHRIAHLRALIGLQPLHAMCRHELATLLRDEITARGGEEGGVV